MKVERTQSRRLFDVDVSHYRDAVNVMVYPSVFKEFSLSGPQQISLSPPEARRLIKALRAQVKRLKRT